MAKRPSKKPYTVIFSVDSRAFEIFTLEVMAKDASNAFDVAVKQAKASGETPSGYRVYPSDWENASEIAVFVGHNLDAYKAERASQQQIAA